MQIDTIHNLRQSVDKILFLATEPPAFEIASDATGLWLLFNLVLQRRELN